MYPITILTQLIKLSTLLEGAKIQISVREPTPILVELKLANLVGQFAILGLAIKCLNTVLRPTKCNLSLERLAPQECLTPF